ncbi:helix-turn-helix domain-containing protein [Lentzea alba]|uniref:helix-turn-helix domain-containing protein n=1 Tax=Lentzea alba TaxID=2714351 RepID=UPI0039BFFCA9
MTTRADSTSVLARALSLLEVLRSTGAPMTLSELSNDSGLAMATCYRMLTIMVNAGVVDKIGKCYAYHHFLNAQGPADDPSVLRLAPFVGELFVKVQRTAALAVLSGVDVAYLHEVRGLRSVGKRFEREVAHQSVAGRALLAFDQTLSRNSTSSSEVDAASSSQLSLELARIRRDRYHIGQISPGVTDVAVPVIGVGGTPLALVVRGAARPLDLEAILSNMVAVSASASSSLHRSLSQQSVRW